MKFFVDSVDVNEVKAALAMGLADGITTNPTLIRKSGKPFKETIKALAALIEGPVCTEVVSEEAQAIFEEGREFTSWAPNVSVKIPITRAGLEAVNRFSREGISTTVTLVFSPVQALLAARAGATYICPFVGRMDDTGYPGMEAVGRIMQIYNHYPEIGTEVIVASVRSPVHILEAAEMGVHGVTVPFKVMEQLAHHPLTDAGIRKFLEDWSKVNDAGGRGR